MKRGSVLVGACLLAFVACDDDLEPVQDGASGTGGEAGATGGSAGSSMGGAGGTAGGAAGATGGSGGGAGSAGVGAEGGSAGAAPEDWYVWVTIERFTHVNEYGERSQASATVFHRDQFAPGANYTTIGEHCNVVQGGWIGVLAQWPKLGTVTIDRAEAPDIDLTLHENNYSSGVATLWEPGEAIKISATGDELSAFAFAITFPESHSPTSPNFDDYDKAEFIVKRSDPLVVKWEPVDSPVRVQLNQYDSQATSEENKMTGVRCVFPGQDGEGAIPTEALGYLSAADSTGQSSSSSRLYFGRDANQKITEGNVVYELDAWNGPGLLVNVE